MPSCKVIGQLQGLEKVLSHPSRAQVYFPAWHSHLSNRKTCQGLLIQIASWNSDKSFWSPTKIKFVLALVGLFSASLYKISMDHLLYIVTMYQGIWVWFQQLSCHSLHFFSTGRKLSFVLLSMASADQALLFLTGYEHSSKNPCLTCSHLDLPCVLQNPGVGDQGYQGSSRL